MPGLTKIIACPQCGQYVLKNGLTNVVGLDPRLYSDGKMVMPEPPSFPDLTKCRKCKTLFWLGKEEVVASFRYTRLLPARWYRVKKAKVLKVKDLFRALEEGLAENEYEELDIRKKIWWLYNDRIRAWKELNTDDDGERTWRSNCKRLIELLDPELFNHRIMIADLKRNLGDFKGCMAIIDEIEDQEHLWLKRIFREACIRKRRMVMPLK